MAIDVRRLTRLAIGINTENGVEEYRFDMRPWLEEYPGLNDFRINVTPPSMEGMPYQAVTHMDGEELVWPIIASDTAIPGDDGWYEIEAFGTNGLHKLSQKRPLTVYARMVGDLSDAPITIQNWVEAANKTIEKTVEAAEDAETAIRDANRAIDTANAAVSASNSAADTANTAANTATAAANAANAAAKEAEDATAAAESVCKGAVVRNLLDNSDFRAGCFIAQAGLNALHGATKYVGDRWISWNQDIVQSDAYITIGSPIDQYIESYKIDPLATYTAAVGFADGTKQVVSGNFTTGFGSKASGCLYCGTASTGKPFVRMQTGFNVCWAALYEGFYTAETLPGYQPKGYAAELAECQLYYENSWYGLSREHLRNFPCTYIASTAGDCFISYRVPKRVVATVILYPYAKQPVWQVYNTTYYDVNTEIQSRDGVNAFLVRFTKKDTDTSVWTIGQSTSLRGHWESCADL